MPESVLTEMLQVEATTVSMNRVLAAIAGMSCASLLLELALTRLFSVVLFYHFAFLAISVALLGLGAGGVYAHMSRATLSRWTVEELGGWLLSANALLILATLEVVLNSAVSLTLELGNFERLTFIY